MASLEQEIRKLGRARLKKARFYAQHPEQLVLAVAIAYLKRYFPQCIQDALNTPQGRLAVLRIIQKIGSESKPRPKKAKRQHHA